jgi:putative transposase
VRALRLRGLSQREACAVVRARRQPSFGWQSQKERDDAAVIKRLTALAQAHPHYGWRRLHALYERRAADGDVYMNHKRFRRLYRLGRLHVHRRRRRRRFSFVRGSWLRQASRPHDIWTVDFLHDRLLHGRAFRALTALDEFCRYGLAVEIEFSFVGATVVAILERLAARHGYPTCLRLDNGPELRSDRVKDWADDHGVTLVFIEPGKPTQNAYIESFNARVREELLNANSFRTIQQARDAAECWRVSHNREHAHSSLGDRTPEEILALYETTAPPQKPVAA